MIEKKGLNTMRYEGVSCVQVCVRRYYFVCVCAKKNKTKQNCVCSSLNVPVEIEPWKSNIWLKAERHDTVIAAVAEPVAKLNDLVFEKISIGK